MQLKGNKKRAESLLRQTQKEFNPEMMQQVGDLSVQGRAVRPTHTPQIKKELPQTSWGSFFMPVVGVEPTRVISTRDFESPSSAIPTHRRIGLNDFYYTGFPGQNQEKVCVFFQIVPHGVKYMTPVLARRHRLCYTKVRAKRK